MQRMARYLGSSALLVSLAAACTTTVQANGEPQGAGGSNDTPESCDTPDTSCPADKPHPGAPCQGALSCAYDQQEVVPWSFTCVGGFWDGEPDCSEIVGGCPVAPPAESCNDTFAGVRDDAALAVGPSTLGAAFRPFEAGEEVTVQWGGQGSAMIFYRVQLDGEDLPGCVLVRTTIAAEGVAPETTTGAVRLRCGETLGMYIIVPYGDCENTEPVPTTLTVEVEGIGQREVMLLVPADAFCGGFG